MDDLILEKKLEDIKKEFAKKQRKLKRSVRAAKAKAHVQRKLKEQLHLEQLSPQTELSSDVRPNTVLTASNESTTEYKHSNLPFTTNDKDDCQNTCSSNDEINLEENNTIQYSLHSELSESGTNSDSRNTHVHNNHGDNHHAVLSYSHEHITNRYHNRDILIKPVGTCTSFDHGCHNANTNPKTDDTEVKCTGEVLQPDGTEIMLPSQDIFESQDSTANMVGHSQSNKSILNIKISNEKRIEEMPDLDDRLNDKCNTVPAMQGTPTHMLNSTFIIDNNSHSHIINNNSPSRNINNSPCHMDTVNKYKTKNIVTKLKPCALVSSVTTPGIKNISINLDRLSLRRRRLKGTPRNASNGSQELSLPSSIESSTDSGTNTGASDSSVHGRDVLTTETRSDTKQLTDVHKKQITDDNVSVAPSTLTLKGEELSSNESLSSHTWQPIHVESDQTASPSSSSQLSLHTDGTTDGATDVRIEETICRRSRSGRSSNSRKRRRSTRLEELSSQDTCSSSQNSQGYEWEISSQPSSHKHPRANAATKKQLIVTSIFQCLVDEGKRDKPNEDFSLPAEIIEQSSTEDKDVEQAISKEGNCSFKEHNANSSQNIASHDTISVENSGRNSVLQSSNVPAMQNSCDNSIRLSIGNIDKSASDSICSDNQHAVRRIISVSESCSGPDILEEEHLDKRLGHHAVTGTMELSEQSEDISPALFGTPPVGQTFIYPEKDDETDRNGIVITCDKQIPENNQIKVDVSEVYIPNNEPEGIVANETHTISSQTDSPIAPCSSETDRSKLDDEGSVETTIKTEATDGLQTLSLQQMATFQISKSEPLLSFVAVEVDRGGGQVLFVVCLCSTCLRLYMADGATGTWRCCHTERLNVTVKRNSGCQIHAIPDSSKVSVILQQPLTEYTEVTAYTYNNNNNMSKVVLDQVWSRSVHVHPLTDTTVIVSNYHAGRTFMSLYIIGATGQENRRDFDEVPDIVKSFASVTGLQGAVVGLSNTGLLHIWNSDHGYLLTSVDISDVCPYESLCAGAFLEEGYMFVPVLVKTRGKDVGSVLVVNPEMGSSETLAPLQAWNKKWTGCTKASMMSHDLLLARESCGHVGIWDVYSGNHLATLDDVTFTGLATTSSHVVVSHKQCMHVYRLTHS